MTMPAQRPLQLVVAYAATLCVFLAIDALWLAVLMKPVYAAALGPLLAESPRWARCLDCLPMAPMI